MLIVDNLENPYRFLKRKLEMPAIPKHRSKFC